MIRAIAGFIQVVRILQSIEQKGVGDLNHPFHSFKLDKLNRSEKREEELQFLIQSLAIGLHNHIEWNVCKKSTVIASNSPSRRTVKELPFSS